MNIDKLIEEILLQQAIYQNSHNIGPTDIVISKNIVDFIKAEYKKYSILNLREHTHIFGMKIAEIEEDNIITPVTLIGYKEG